MNNQSTKPPANNDMSNIGIRKPLACDDAYYTRGRDFQTPDADKGVESGPQETVDQSSTQLDRGLLASGKVNGPSIKGQEGKAFFPPDKNSKNSEDESQTFEGNRAEVSLSLKTGQIVSGSNDVKGNRV